MAETAASRTLMRPAMARAPRIGRLTGAMAVFLLAASALTMAAEPQTVLLWPAGAPGSEGRSGAETVRVNEHGEHIVSNVHAPSITVSLPTRAAAASAAIVVIPGGGHTELWMDHEGYNVAAFLMQHGVAAAVLKYRLARAPGSAYSVEGNSLKDVQRAIRLLRSRAAQWNIDPNRVGVMGFSAGGELAALAATQYDTGMAMAADAIEQQSSRPSFQALLYPGIPSGMILSSDTPPAFLLCGAEDQPAISQGLADLYLRLRRAGAHAELHIYDGVGHGFGLRAGNTGPVAEWPRRFLEWLGQQGISPQP
jgi:acetyl esterase/lipase